MTWQQPVPGPDGTLTLTEMNHPCTNGCSGWFKVPAAERGPVVASDALTAGNVASVNHEHRTEWFLPVPPPVDHRAAPPT